MERLAAEIDNLDLYLKNPNLLSSILDLAGILVVVLDPEGRIVHFNATCERATGYTLSEVRGRYLWDLLLVPEQIEGVKGVFYELSEGRARNVYDNFWVKKDGQRMCVHWANTFVRGPDGRVRLVIGTGTDITEKKRAELELKDREARLRGIVDTVVDGIITIDGEGRIQSFNPSAERIFGYVSEEVIGRNVAMLMSVQDRDRHDRYLADYLTTGDAKIVGIGRQVSGRRKDGSIFPMELAVSESNIGGVRRFTGIVRDITERIEAAKRERTRLAEHAHAARLASLGEMVSGIAHELNQPLAAIVSFADACQRLVGNEEIPTNTLRNAFTQIAQQGERAGKIIRRLREFVRTGEIEHHDVDVNTLVEDVIELVEYELRQKQIVVELDLGSELPTVSGDKLQLEQVTLNLLRNSIEAMDNQEAESRRLSVRTRKTPDGVEVCVRDRGRGFAAADKDNLFAAFYTTKKGGTGLGLSISHSIIQAHGGTISARPNPQGGAIFRFTLPAHQGRTGCRNPPSSS